MEPSFKASTLRRPRAVCSADKNEPSVRHHGGFEPLRCDKGSAPFRLIEGVAEAIREKERSMSKILVLYYSSYGHIEAMARAAAEGAAANGSQVEIRRVPETVPEEIANKSGFRVNKSHPEAEPADLEDCDAIIVATPTNYGNICSQMSEFWARTTGLWKKGALIGKLGGAISSSATQHGGNEATLLAMHKTMLHHGMFIVGLPYSFQGQLEMGHATGGSPYGATTIAGSDMARQPSVNELDGAMFQGKHISDIAARMFETPG
jgi:NAD(P)H dehydrogenase (quinone)